MTALIRRTPTQQQELARVQAELRAAEARLSEMRLHGWYLPETQAEEARVAALREELARVRRAGAA